MEPAIKQEVLDGDRPAQRVPNEYIESSDDKDKKAKYNIIKERLEAHGNNYNAGTRLSKGYLRKQYEINIKAKHTRVTLLSLTLPPLTIIEALECDSETQVRQWARGNDKLTLSQLDSQD
jgi:hypothetical protein